MTEPRAATREEINREWPFDEEPLEEYGCLHCLEIYPAGNFLVLSANRKEGSWECPTRVCSGALLDMWPPEKIKVLRGDNG